MNIKETIQGIGGVLLWFAIILFFGFILTLFFQGAGWVSAKLLPWFSLLSWIGIALVVFIFFPLSFPRATRGFSSTSIFIASYVFGATLWMVGLLYTLTIWGTSAAIIGILLGGVGVVPIAMLATLFNGYWVPLTELLVLTVVTFGCRIWALKLAESV